MLTIIRCNDSFVEEEILYKARVKLSQFNNLQFVFNNFEDFKFDSSHNKNTVFVKCIKGDSNSVDYLRRMEKALCNLIDKKKLFIKRNGQVNTKFINRMTSSEPWDFCSVISEIFVADYLLALFGPHNFQYEEGKKSERKPDFIINTNDRLYSLEVRTLMKGSTEEKIETIFDQVCIYILNLIKERDLTCNIVIRTDTSRLCVNQEKQIDVERSRKYLTSYFDKLDILSLSRSKIAIDFEYVRRSVPLAEKTLDSKASQVFKNIPYSSFITFDQSHNATLDAIIEWLDKIEIKYLLLCPFDTLGIMMNQERSCVSMSPIDVDFEDKDLMTAGIAASEMNKKSFIDQIRRAIEDKNKLVQWKKGHPAIVVLDTFNWHFEYFDYQGFLSIRKPIEQELEKYPDISGVILFHEIVFGNEHYRFYDGRYIENRGCRPELRVTVEELQEANILRKYNDPVLTYDKRIDFQTLDEKQQVERIVDLINLESKLTREDDKIELLKTIELYLYRSQADNKIIIKLEPLIKKYCNDPEVYGVDASIIIEELDLCPLTPVSIRPLAASCQLKITKHDPSVENINFSVKLYDDSNTLIREAVCSNLGFLSEIDFQAAFKIAKQALDDNWRVRLYLGKYLQYIINEHEDEAFELIEEIIEKSKRQDTKLLKKDTAVEIAVHILTYKALRFKAQKFRKYFDIILNDASYPLEVKKIIAFTCKGDRLLFDKNLFDEVIGVYTTLVKSPSPSVYEYAAFHLFYNIQQKGEPYYEGIKPLLEILSRKNYDPSFPFWESAKVIIYLMAFCRQIPTEDTIMFLERLCHNYPFLVEKSPENWKVLDVLECLMEDKITPQSKEKVKSLILKLVKSGTPTAENLLKKLEDEV